MYLSYSTVNRIVEEKKAEDPAYRARVEKNERPYLSLARNMSDDELVSKLRQLGLDVGREWLLDTFPRYISAEAMACNDRQRAVRHRGNPDGLGLDRRDQPLAAMAAGTCQHRRGE